MLPGEHQYQNFVGKCLIQKQALEGLKLFILSWVWKNCTITSFVWLNPNGTKAIKVAWRFVALVLVRCYPYRDGCLECCGAICLSLQCDLAMWWPVPCTWFSLSLSLPPPKKKIVNYGFGLFNCKCSEVTVSVSLRLK